MQELNLVNTKINQIRSIPIKGKENLQLYQTKTTKKRQSRRHERAINDFTEAFKNIPDRVVQDQTASNHNENDNLHLDENNRFISIICLICNMIQTQHQYLFEVAGGLVYNCKNIYGKAFCAPCGDSWGCERAPWRCQIHIWILS